jgi:hypothetical protein
MYFSTIITPDMRIKLDYILFAENVVNDSSTGKLTIVNTFNGVLAPKLPLVQNTLKLISVFDAVNVKKGDVFAPTLIISAPSGKELFNNVVQKFVVQEDDENNINFNVFLNGDGITFTEYGSYSFVIKSGDKILAERKLMVVKEHTSKVFPAEVE